MTLEELKKLCDEAVPGPWSFDSYAPEGDDPEHYSWRILSPGDSYFDILRCGYDATNHDTGRFIAAAREMMPKLIKVAEAAERFTDPDYEDIMGSRSKGEVARLQAALAALEADLRII